ncbi:MAG: hypothetical protein U1A77_14100 [Pirellulales bacterium]
MDNPYSAPSIEPAAPKQQTLYSPGQIAWASFLGSPLAGGILMALNYRRFGNSTAAALTFTAGLVGTVLLMVISFFLPDNFPGSIVPAAYTWGLYQSAKQLQGDAYRTAIEQGGATASGWATTGVGALCLIAVIMLLLAVLFVAPEEWFAEELPST